MVAPGFRSRIATGLLVAAVVLPVPIGATSAAACGPAGHTGSTVPAARPAGRAARRRPGDAGADGFGLDGYGADDLAPGPPPARARGRSAPGDAPVTGGPGRLPELPDHFPGLPGRPFRASRTGRRITTSGGSAGTGGGTTTRITLRPWRLRAGPAALRPGRPDGDGLPEAGQARALRRARARPTPTVRTRRPGGAPRSRSAASLRRPTPCGSGHPVTAAPLRAASMLADRFTRRSYEALPPLPDARPGGACAPHRRARMTNRRPRRRPYAMRPPGPRSSGCCRWAPAWLSPVWAWPSSPCGCAGTEITVVSRETARIRCFT